VRKTAAAQADADVRCDTCSTEIRNEGGIWTALSSQRQEHFRQFISEYQQVRAAEGRGSEDDTYYLALPFRDLSGRNQQQWAIRGRTYGYLERYILPRLEAVTSALDLLDLGAGNGWLDYRLALRGHRPVAVDLLTNCADGLGAADRYHKHLDHSFACFQAEFSRLPFSDCQFDCAVFNASFHYAESYEEVLGEAIRCLRPGGWIVIADSPWYPREESGEQMLLERRRLFSARYGFASDSIRSQEYLTDARLQELAARFALNWEIHHPWYGLRWRLRPLMAQIKRKRQPSEFRIYLAQVKSP
jgi:SAM-dependent methyltransferase